MTNAETTEIVADPVGHISISGVHGRDELAFRRARVPARPRERPNPIAVLLVGAVVGAAMMYLLNRD